MWVHNYCVTNCVCVCRLMEIVVTVTTQSRYVLDKYQLHTVHKHANDNVCADTNTNTQSRLFHLSANILGRLLAHTHSSNNSIEQLFVSHFVRVLVFQCGLRAKMCAHTHLSHTQTRTQPNTLTSVDSFSECVSRVCAVLHTLETTFVHKYVCLLEDILVCTDTDTHTDTYVEDAVRRQRMVESCVRAVSARLHTTIAQCAVKPILTHFVYLCVRTHIAHTQTQAQTHTSSPLQCLLLDTHTRYTQAAANMRSLLKKCVRTLTASFVSASAHTHKQHRRVLRQLECVWTHTIIQFYVCELQRTAHTLGLVYTHTPTNTQTNTSAEVNIDVCVGSHAAIALCECLMSAHRHAHSVCAVDLHTHMHTHVGTENNKQAATGTSVCTAADIALYVLISRPHTHAHTQPGSLLHEMLHKRPKHTHPHTDTHARLSYEPSVQLSETLCVCLLMSCAVALAHTLTNSNTASASPHTQANPHTNTVTPTHTDARRNALIEFVSTATDIHTCGPFVKTHELLLARRLMTQSATHTNTHTNTNTHTDTLALERSVLCALPAVYHGLQLLDSVDECVAVVNDFRVHLFVKLDQTHTNTHTTTHTTTHTCTHTSNNNVIGLKMVLGEADYGFRVCVLNHDGWRQVVSSCVSTPFCVYQGLVLPAPMQFVVDEFTDYFNVKTMCVQSSVQASTMQTHTARHEAVSARKRLTWYYGYGSVEMTVRWPNTHASARLLVNEPQAVILSLFNDVCVLTAQQLSTQSGLSLLQLTPVLLSMCAHSPNTSQPSLLQQVDAHGNTIPFSVLLSAQTLSTASLRTHTSSVYVQSDWRFAISNELFTHVCAHTSSSHHTLSSSVCVLDYVNTLSSDANSNDVCAVAAAVQRDLQRWRDSVIDAAIVRTVKKYASNDGSVSAHELLERVNKSLYAHSTQTHMSPVRLQELVRRCEYLCDDMGILHWIPGVTSIAPSASACASAATQGRNHDVDDRLPSSHFLNRRIAYFDCGMDTGDDLHQTQHMPVHDIDKLDPPCSSKPSCPSLEATLRVFIESKQQNNHETCGVISAAVEVRLLVGEDNVKAAQIESCDPSATAMPKLDVDVDGISEEHKYQRQQQQQQEAATDDGDDDDSSEDDSIEANDEIVGEEYDEEGRLVGYVDLSTPTKALKQLSTTIEAKQCDRKDPIKLRSLQAIKCSEGQVPPMELDFSTITEEEFLNVVVRWAETVTVSHTVVTTAKASGVIPNVYHVDDNHGTTKAAAVCISEALSELCVRMCGDAVSVGLQAYDHMLTSLCSLVVAHMRHPQSMDTTTPARQPVQTHGISVPADYPQSLPSSELILWSAFVKLPASTIRTTISVFDILTGVASVNDLNCVLEQQVADISQLWLTRRPILEGKQCDSITAYTRSELVLDALRQLNAPSISLCQFVLACLFVAEILPPLPPAPHAGEEVAVVYSAGESKTDAKASSPIISPNRHKKHFPSAPYVGQSQPKSGSTDALASEVQGMLLSKFPTLGQGPRSSHTVQLKHGNPNEQQQKCKPQKSCVTVVSNIFSCLKSVTDSLQFALVRVLVVADKAYPQPGSSDDAVAMDKIELDVQEAKDTGTESGMPLIVRDPCQPTNVLASAVTEAATDEDYQVSTTSYACNVFGILGSLYHSGHCESMNMTFSGSFARKVSSVYQVVSLPRNLDFGVGTNDASSKGVVTAPMAASDFTRSPFCDLLQFCGGDYFAVHQAIRKLIDQVGFVASFQVFLIYIRARTGTILWNQRRITSRRWLSNRRFCPSRPWQSQRLG
jgi:hypothetical protein